jgi:hypothetical protein
MLQLSGIQVGKTVYIQNNCDSDQQESNTFDDSLIVHNVLIASFLAVCLTVTSG